MYGLGLSGFLGVGFRVLGFWVYGLGLSGFRVFQGLGCMVWGFQVLGVWLGVWGLWVQGLGHSGFRVHGLEYRALGELRI